MINLTITPERLNAYIQGLHALVREFEAGGNKKDASHYFGMALELERLKYDHEHPQK